MNNGICVGGPKHLQIAEYDGVVFKSCELRPSYNKPFTPPKIYTYHYHCFIRAPDTGDKHEYGVWLIEGVTLSFIDDCIRAAEERIRNGRR